jgi:hypothetical protein
VKGPQKSKKPYNAPRLTKYGSAAKLTAGSASPNTEAGGGKKILAG